MRVYGYKVFILIIYIGRGIEGGCIHEPECDEFHLKF